MADGGGGATRPPYDVVMCHIDLDCFYAQVEMVRVGAPRGEPFVVSQWGSLIAVNYPARAAGVGRMDNLEAAKSKCSSNLRWEHVATYAPGCDSWSYHPEALVRKSTHKVSLEPYRIASRKIFDVLKSYEGVLVEKGGIDEAFLDVTAAARSRWAAAMEEVEDRSVAKACNALREQCKAVTAFLDEAHDRMRDRAALAAAPIEDDSLETQGVFYAACMVVNGIRADLRTKLQYDASAGIAKNRTLAKVISATHKPNAQTLLLPGASRTFLYRLPVTKLRGFGGKFGASLARHFVAETCGDLWSVPAEQFKLFTGNDETEAREVFARIRGLGNDTSLKERDAPKSLLAQKAFYPASDDDRVLHGWLLVLAKELVQRMAVVFEEHEVRPYSFNIKVGSKGLSSTDVLNKSQELPWPPDGEKLATLAFNLVKHALANRPNKGGAPLKVDCFLLGATVLKPDPQTSLVDGAFTVRHRQVDLAAWMASNPEKKKTAKQDRDATFALKPAAGESPPKASRAEEASGPVNAAKDGVEDDDDIEVLTGDRRPHHDDTATVRTGHRPSVMNALKAATTTTSTAASTGRVVKEASNDQHDVLVLDDDDDDDDGAASVVTID